MGNFSRFLLSYVCLTADLFAHVRAALKPINLAFFCYFIWPPNMICSATEIIKFIFSTVCLIPIYLHTIHIFCDMLRFVFFFILDSKFSINIRCFCLWAANTRWFNAGTLPHSSEWERKNAKQKSFAHWGLYWLGLKKPKAKRIKYFKTNRTAADEWMFWSIYATFKMISFVHGFVLWFKCDSLFFSVKHSI